MHLNETTALDLYYKHNLQTRRIESFCRDFDYALGGGIILGHITEFCGAPGSGKTQFCLQLCVNIQLPTYLGGNDGKAVFIDTRGGFVASRFNEIASGAINTINKIPQHKMNIQDQDVHKQFTIDSITANIFVHYVDSLSKLQSAITNLVEFIKYEKNIRLIVIDSFAFYFKCIENSYLRMNCLYECITVLLSIISSNDIAIVITNEMTTDLNTVNAVTKEIIPVIVPALGESHSHKINQRIHLYRNPKKPNHFIAKILKCLHRPVSKVEFSITADGIR